jgi:BASS family bile acid:Na+ symporter
MPLAMKLLGVIAVTTYMLQTGLAMPPGGLAACAKNKKAELARSLLVMLVLGPLAARLVVAAFALPPRPALALVLLSFVGVVPLASRGARNARGNVPTAILLTAVLGLVVAFTAAPTTRLVFGYHGQVEVHTMSLLVEILVLQGVPLAVGLMVRSKMASHARELETALGVFNTFVVIALVILAALIVPRHGAVRSLGWTGALAAIVFSVFIAGAGYLLVGADREARRTLAAIANKPNVILAILIVSSAGLDAGFAVAVVGVFLVRLFTGIVIQRVLARSAKPLHQGLA